jgi:phosphoglycolate phosphatase-like HAD superfamily hydrolase
VPYASADDAGSKAGVVACAIKRARPSGGADRVVYVGDRPWDLNAARELKVEFLGVSEGRMAEELTAAGADAVIGGFEDVPAVAKMLDEKARGCFKTCSDSRSAGSS